MMEKEKRPNQLDLLSNLYQGSLSYLLSLYIPLAQTSSQCQPVLLRIVKLSTIIIPYFLGLAHAFLK